jgi:AraC-like DNA-binding protein
MTTKIMRALTNDETLQSVKDIARIVGRSERSLQLLFNTYVGVSLKWVIARRRLLRTVQKIHDHTSSTWTEAAAEQGYSSQSHFTRDLKKVIGLPPSQYLKSTYVHKEPSSTFYQK